MLVWYKAFDWLNIHVLEVKHIGLCMEGGICKERELAKMGRKYIKWNKLLKWQDLKHE